MTGSVTAWNCAIDMIADYRLCGPGNFNAHWKNAIDLGQSLQVVASLQKVEAIKKFRLPKGWKA